MSAPLGIEFKDDVTSDVSFVARGRSVEQAFARAAEALLQLTIENPAAVEDRIEHGIELDEPGPELLLLAFLGELVFLRDARGWLLRARDLEIELEPGRARLRGRLVGDVLDPLRHERAADVKAATAHGLRVAERDGIWEIAVTLDV